MAKTSLLLTELRRDHPVVTFEPGDDFYWSPTNQTVYFAALDSALDRLTLLHETAHALLGHQGYSRDINLLKIEREAWELARDTLAPHYGLKIETELIEEMLDSYRDWLHARSRCPKCQLTGIQTDESTYQCLGCNATWHVNEARRCRLKRTSLS